MTEYTVETARKVLDVVDVGLVGGLGIPMPGAMCVEAAICYALGLPHSDDPGCVEPVLRAFNVSLNDKRWPSSEARARGLRALAVAQLGSKGVVDGREFAKRLAEQFLRQVAPITIRAVAQHCSGLSDQLEASARRCEREGTIREAEAARNVMRAAGPARALSVAAQRNLCAAHAVLSSAASGMDAAFARDGSHAAWVGSVLDTVVVATSLAEYPGDQLLTKLTDIALQILRDLKAPGVALWDQVAGCAEARQGRDWSRG
jgi:hypothetical protein